FQSDAQTKEIAIRPKPSWVKNYSYNAEVRDTANTSNGYFTLLNESQHNTILHQSYYHFAIKIISEAGLESNSTLSVDFDPSYEEVTFHKVKVIRNGKKINHLFKNSFDVLRREKNMDMMIYDKNLTALFNFQDLQVGDIIEYDYTHTGENPLYKNKYSKFFSFNFSSPVGLIQSRLIAKRGT